MWCINLYLRSLWLLTENCTFVTANRLFSKLLFYCVLQWLLQVAIDSRLKLSEKWCGKNEAPSYYCQVCFFSFQRNYLYNTYILGVIGHIVASEHTFRKLVWLLLSMSWRVGTWSSARKASYWYDIQTESWMS